MISETSFKEFFAYLVSSTTITGFLVWWAKQLIEKKYSREIHEQKIKAETDIKKAVETHIGDIAAERNYLYEAKRRLYLHIGPLNFQILIACRDFSGRIMRHGSRSTFAISTSEYYGQSTLYRLLKPLALLEIVERTITVADFSIDQTALNLLKLKNSLHKCLSTSKIVLDHPQANLASQAEHIFVDNVSIIAEAMLLREPDGSDRIMRFSEFQHCIQNQETGKKLDPIVEIFNKFSLQSMPLFWLRLVAFGYICTEYARTSATSIGMKIETFSINELLEATLDQTLITRKDEYRIFIESVVHDNFL